ncbi:hypothetical protein VTN02DRAFT_6683 [Thermoascus thermophilus]
MPSPRVRRRRIWASWGPGGGDGAGNTWAMASRRCSRTSWFSAGTAVSRRASTSSSLRWSFRPTACRAASVSNGEPSPTCLRPP